MTEGTGGRRAGSNTGGEIRMNEDRLLKIKKHMQYAIGLGEFSREDAEDIQWLISEVEKLLDSLDRAHILLDRYEDLL